MCIVYGDRLLQLHTARRSYRLSDTVNNSEIDLFSFAEHVFRSLVEPHHLEEGGSRNKVSAGEPAERSFTHVNVLFVHVALWPLCMKFRRSTCMGQGWGGGFDDYGQQSSPATFLIIFFHHLIICHFR